MIATYLAHLQKTRKRGYRNGGGASRFRSSPRRPISLPISNRSSVKPPKPPKPKTPKQKTPKPKSSKPKSRLSLKPPKASKPKRLSLNPSKPSKSKRLSLKPSKPSKRMRSFLGARVFCATILLVFTTPYRYLKAHVHTHVANLIMNTFTLVTHVRIFLNLKI